MKRKLLVSLSLLLVIVASSWALLKPGMFDVHDFIHGVRITEMTSALQEGQFPVRWSQNFGYGYGMPLFEFYAPLPYFIGSLLYQVGFPLITAVKALFLLSSVGTLLAAYFFAKELFKSKAAGVLVAAALTLAPYRALNLFVRGALSESWGMMAIPIVLWGLIKIRTHFWKGWGGITFGLVILLLSHNLTALISAPFFVLFYLFQLGQGYYLQKIRLQELGKELSGVISSVLLAVGLAAFYIFPALLEKDFTQVDATILSGYFDFSLHFLYIRQFFTAFWGYGGSEWGPNDPISFYLGTGQLVSVVGSLLLVVQVIRNSAVSTSLYKKRKIALFNKIAILGILFLLIGLGLFLSLERSILVWRALPFMSYIQFPWRYLSITSVFLASSVGVPLFFLKGRKARFYIVGMFFLLLSTASIFKPKSYLDAPEKYYYDNPARVASEMSKTLPDYIPSAMILDGIQPPQQQLECLQDECEYEVIESAGHKKIYQFVASETDRQVLFSIADFPGWQVFVDGVQVEKRISPTGLLEAALPAGGKIVKVVFQSTQVRKISDTISAVSLLLVVVLYLYISQEQKIKKERS